MGPIKRHLFYLLFLSGCFVSSCSTVITGNIIQPAVGNLQQQTDLDLVCEGAPAYLLMLDSMLVSAPDNKKLLLTASQSYSAYATALSECAPESNRRIPQIAAKAKKYGVALLAQYIPLEPSTDPLIFEEKLENQSHKNVEDLFWGTFAWLTWVQAQKGSPESIADLVTIEKIMIKLLELDPTFQGGSIHVFFGTYNAAKPVMLGGKPDLAREHFEQALKLSGRKFLMTQTTYASTYARVTMNQDLHDKLLKEVLKFPLDSAPEFSLSNTIAKNRAQKLLDENYFGI